MANYTVVAYVLPLVCFGILLFFAFHEHGKPDSTVNNHLASPGGIRREHEAKNWSWVDVFSFVPNAIEDCTNLFPDSKELPPDFAKEYDKFTSLLGFKVTEGYSALFREEFLAYIKCVQAPFVRTVCETGFNAGHSTFTWLAANPRTHVYSFDIGQHSYSRPAAAKIAARFPGRFTITWGDSTETLPAFYKQNPAVKCDLIIIDGGHKYDACKSDLDVFKKMANPNNILILDNYPDTRGQLMTTLGTVWEQGKQNGHIAEIFKCHYKKQGFSVGRIIKE